MMTSPTRNSTRSSFTSSSRTSTRTLMTSSSRRESSLESRRSRKSEATLSYASWRSILSEHAKVENNQEEKIIPEDLETVYSRFESMEQSVLQNVKKVKQTHSAVKADIKKFRKQMDETLDAWEDEVLSGINDILESDLANLNAVLDESRKMVDEMQKLTNGVSEYQIKLYEVSAIDLETKNSYKEYKFIGNAVLANIFKSETTIGEVKITQDVAGLYNNMIDNDGIVPTYVEDINVKSNDDSFDCDVTGMAFIGAHRLVIADSDNKVIKCIDTHARIIMSYLHLASAPWDLTKFHRGQVAVTIPSERLIQFVNTNNILREGRILRVSGECRGIAYFRECLVISFRNPGKVQIITLNGRVLKNIKLSIQKSRIFDWPDYVTINRHNGLIYVSDWRRNAVTRLNWKGEVTAIFKDVTGTKMAGLAVAKDGGVYVSKRASHSIIKLKPDLTADRTVLEEKHGLKYPWSLCFDEEENVLYVDTNRNSNSVSVFELR